MERKRLNLTAQEKKPPAKMKAKAKSVEEEEENTSVEDDDDDDVLASVPEKGKGKNHLLVGVIGVIVVAVIILAFLLFGGKKNDDIPDTAPGSPPPITQPDANPAQQEQQNSQGDQTGQNGQTGQEAPPGIGTQDFTGNTTMQSGSVLTNPDEYVEDLYGLTTRVDYTVDKITTVADFVSYEKHRGTWGGGLELYWLDATYKGNKYVIQVPFQYYKELDDMGIVPVKMEVLTIRGSVEGETLSVISYMCLDEATLKDILKNQVKN